MADGDGIRQIIQLNDDWQFQMDGSNGWETVDIPHDFSMKLKVTEKEEPEYGFFPGGKANYKKTFTLPQVTGAFNCVVYFYGAYKNTYVTINGNKVGENHYGYSSFAFDITKFVKADGQSENVLEVRVEHQTPSSRWYSGSGLLRGVEIILTGGVHINVDGIKIPQASGGNNKAVVEAEVVNGGSESSKVQLNLVVYDKSGQVAGQAAGQEAVEVKAGETKVLSGEITVQNAALWDDVNPNLYSMEVQLVNGDNVLDKYVQKFGFRYYTIDGKVGFTINGRPTKMHGVSIHHDYGALGGIDSYDAAYKRFTQLKNMGVNAIRTTHNTAHKTWINLCDELGIYVVEEFFDAWNHAKHDNKYEFAEYFSQGIKSGNGIIGGKEGMTWAEYVIKSTIKRDRNNPSVIMWSLGNEVGFDSNSPSLVKNMVLWGSQMDESRKFTLGEHELRKNFSGTRKDVCDALVSVGGIIGYNYGDITQINDGYKYFGILYSSETGSSLNSRGMYLSNGNKKDDGHFHLPSYDTSYASWPLHYPLYNTLNYDYLFAQFPWTGYDYIGEPTPWNGYAAGSVSGQGTIPNTAYFGIIDTANFPKDTYYMYRAQLRRDKWTLNMVTAWDKDNMCYSGNTKRSPVHVYTNFPKVEIYRSDKNSAICVMTRKNVKTQAGYEYYTYSAQSADNNLCEVVNPASGDGTELFSRFNIEFQEGTTLTAKGFDDQGKEVDSKQIEGKTAARAPDRSKIQFSVEVDKTQIKADGRSLVFVEVSLVDDQGFLDTKGSNVISFTVEGEGKIVGVDNGDQGSVDKFQQDTVLRGDDLAVIKAYAGKALGVVSSTKKSGSIKVTISSDGIADKVVEIKSG